MELVSRFFGKRSQKSDKRKISRLQAASLEQSRRELIAMALRDTLRKHGPPAGCITVEGLPGSEVGGQRGLHLQFVFRDWQSSLLLSYVGRINSTGGDFVHPTIANRAILFAIEGRELTPRASWRLRWQSNPRQQRVCKFSRREDWRRYVPSPTGGAESLRS